MQELAHESAPEAARAAGDDDIQRCVWQLPHAFGGRPVRQGEDRADEEADRSTHPGRVRGLCTLTACDVGMPVSSAEEQQQRLPLCRAKDGVECLLTLLRTRTRPRLMDMGC